MERKPSPLKQVQISKARLKTKFIILDLSFANPSESRRAEDYFHQEEIFRENFNHEPYLTFDVCRVFDYSPLDHLNIF